MAKKNRKPNKTRSKFSFALAVKSGNSRGAHKVKSKYSRTQGKTDWVEAEGWMEEEADVWSEYDDYPH